MPWKRLRGVPGLGVSPVCTPFAASLSPLQHHPSLCPTSDKGGRGPFLGSLVGTGDATSVCPPCCQARSPRCLGEGTPQGAPGARHGHLCKGTGDRPQGDAGWLGRRFPFRSCGVFPPSIPISQLGKAPGVFSLWLSPRDRPVRVPAGSLAAMEEGEDAPVGDQSPSERDGAASDREGSAERDTCSPPGSDGEPWHCPCCPLPTGTVSAGGAGC